MKNVRIGGVPEHFNYAWYLALKQGHFKPTQYQCSLEGLFWWHRSNDQSTSRKRN